MILLGLIIVVREGVDEYRFCHDSLEKCSVGLLQIEQGVHFLLTCQRISCRIENKRVYTINVIYCHKPYMTYVIY